MSTQAHNSAPSVKQLVECLVDSGYSPNGNEEVALANAMLLAIKRYGSHADNADAASLSDDHAIRVGEAVRNECLSLVHDGDPLHNIRRLNVEEVVKAVCTYSKNTPQVVAWRIRQYDYVEREHSNVWVVTQDSSEMEVYRRNNAIVEELTVVPSSSN